MIKKIVLFVFFMGVYADRVLPASTAPDEVLYVGNSKANTVSVIDLSSLKTIREIPTGADIHCVAVTPDGKTLFTTTHLYHTRITTDTSTGKTVGTVKLPGRPNECAVTPDGHFVTVPIRDGDSVAIVDVPLQKIVKILPIKEP